MVDEKALIAKCREFLDGQKIQNKMVTPPDIMFKIKDHTFVLNPIHPSGHPIIGKKVHLNIATPKEWNELWAKANARFAMDDNFDEWFSTSLTGYHTAASQPPTQAWIFYMFDTESDLGAMMGDPETFKGYCEKLRIFCDYITTEDKRV
jgi:hypothetical protein